MFSAYFLKQKTSELRPAALKNGVIHCDSGTIPGSPTEIEV
jgi:hypothetical protein